MQQAITGKASMHIDKKWSHKHNVREYSRDKWNTDGHINYDRTPNNITLIDRDVRQFFEETFGEAIAEYNAKNRKKHPDRVISIDKYYTENKGKVQECIIQMGNHENYVQLCEQVGQKRADEIHIQFLTEVYQQWLKDNPSLKVFSAVIHMDEVKDGTPHIHIDFLPVAESTKGLKTKVTVDGAMKQLGYARKKDDKYSETPYKRWLAHQRECVEQLAGKYIQIVPSEPYSKQKRQETWQWRAEQKKYELAEQEQNLKDIQDKALNYDKNPKKGLLESQSAYEKRVELENKANAVMELRSELDEKKKKLDERESDIQSREETIDQTVETARGGGFVRSLT